jgi:phosphoserine phosphatase SerB
MNKENKKMVIFDMDNTLLKGRFIDTCAKEYNFSQALELLRQIDKNPISLTVRIAGFLRGKSKKELLELASTIPVVEDSAEVINALKERGYKIGIISDSYNIITQQVENRLGVDFSFANELQFENDECTGEVLIPSLFHFSENSPCRHQICKTNAILHACKKFNIDIKDCTVIGDSANDLCMIRHAGLGIAYGEDIDLRNAAAKYISNGRFSELLKYAV